MSDNEHFQSVNDLHTGAVVTNFAAVTCSIDELCDECQLSLLQKIIHFVVSTEERCVTIQQRPQTLCCLQQKLFAWGKLFNQGSVFRQSQ